MSRSLNKARGPALVTGLICAALGINFVRLGLAPAQVVAAGSQYRLPAAADVKISVAPGIDDQQLRQAIHAAPLKQAVVNAAMVTAVARNKSTPLAPWLEVVASLGWRDVTSQQNIIAAGIQRQDIASIVNSADALLRIGTLFPEAAAVMNLAEAYPGTWPRVFALLKSNVSWRHAYMGQASSSMLPAVMDGRIRTIEALQRAGDRPDRQQVRPLVAALATAGREPEADRLWRDYTGDRASLLYDTRFERALAQVDQPLTPLSFDWSLNLDTGYTTDIASNGLGGAVVTIRWDGRGVPVFFSQQTSAQGGHQILKVRVDGETQGFAERVGFRLRCRDSVTEFEPVRRPGTIELTLTTVQGVACSYPFLEAYGRPGKTRRGFRRRNLSNFAEPRRHFAVSLAEACVRSA